MKKGLSIFVIIMLLLMLCVLDSCELPNFGNANSSFSKGLAFELNKDGESYSVVGIGTCTDKDIVIPDTYEGLRVTTIGVNAFRNCEWIKSVRIPNSVTRIRNYAFNNCASLESVVIGDSVASIGNYAFYECTSLKSIEIPDCVERVGEHAFDKCTSLSIFCEAEEEPIGWAVQWNFSGCPVVWGYTGE